MYHAGQPAPDGVIQRQPVFRDQLQQHDRDERLGVAADPEEPVGVNRLAAVQAGHAAGAAQFPAAGAYLGQHPRYSGCGDRVEVALQVLLQVGMAGLRRGRRGGGSGSGGGAGRGGGSQADGDPSAYVHEHHTADGAIRRQ